MKKYLFTLITIILFLPLMVNATSGALKQGSIKKCPDGSYYGYHGSNNHWHMATLKSGKYYADGEPLSGDPCKKVKVTFSPGAGKVSPTSKYFYRKYKYGSLPKPTRRGYDFAGWYTAKSGGTKIVSTSKVDKARTLYARWGRHKYKITYVLNTGTNNKANPATYRITDSVTLKNPTRKGAIFKGWFSDKGLKKKVTGIKKGTIGNKTFYTKWAATTYKLEYKANGGTGTMSAVTGLKYNKTYTLDANKFKRTGYSFEGWNRRADGTGTNYADQANFKNLTATNNGTGYMYAMWKETDYTITYHLDDGINDSDNPSTYNINSNVTLKNPIKEGYTFLGWYSDSEYTNKVTSIDTGTTGNMDLYAKWEEQGYTITYHLNGGTNNPDNVGTFTGKEEVVLYEPTRRGYEFTGWYTDEEFVEYIDKIEVGTERNINVYASWQPVHYTITYHMNGGTNNVSNISSYTINDEITLYDPTRYGFEFKGWYFDEWFDEDPIEVIPEGTTGDLDIYANWTEYRYNINYYVGEHGDNNLGNPFTFTQSQEVILLDPSRRGASFGGWYTEDSFLNLITKIEYGTDHDVSVYAKWNLEVYTITYNLNGGVNNPNNVSTYTVEDEVTFYDPTKEGYSFYGWYNDEEFTQEMGNLPAEHIGNVELFAKWGTIKYDIHYNIDGGINSPDNPDTFTADDSFAFSEPTKNGYEFKGWYSDSSFTTEVTGIEQGTTSDVTVYAKWEPISYNIAYYFVNAGENDPRNVSNYTVEDTVTLYPASRDGFTFSGWVLDTQNPEYITSIPKGTTGTINLYAQWAPLTFHINYVLNGGTNSIDNPETFTSASVFNFQTPIREGYRFAGWYTDPEFTNQITGIDYGTSHDVTIYAKWYSTENYDDALARAQYYLNGEGFSLEYLRMALNGWDGFSEEATQYALDNCNANWNQQAITRALRTVQTSGGLSKPQVKDRLMTSYLFENEQAEYAVNNANIDWIAQAQTYASNAVNKEDASYTRESLIAEMIGLGFTEEEAAAAADWVNL